MRRGKVIVVVTTENFKGKRGRRRPRDIQLGRLVSWHGGLSELIGLTRARRLSWHGNHGDLTLSLRIRMCSYRHHGLDTMSIVLQYPYCKARSTLGGLLVGRFVWVLTTVRPAHRSERNGELLNVYLPKESYTPNESFGWLRRHVNNMQLTCLWNT